MGQDFAQYDEWAEDRSLEWELLQYDEHKQMQNYVKALNAFTENIRHFTKWTMIRMDLPGSITFLPMKYGSLYQEHKEKRRDADDRLQLLTADLRNHKSAFHTLESTKKSSTATAKNSEAAESVIRD